MMSLTDFTFMVTAMVANPIAIKTEPGACTATSGIIMIMLINYRIAGNFCVY